MADIPRLLCRWIKGLLSARLQRLIPLIPLSVSHATLLGDALESGTSTVRACTSCGVCCYSALETYVRVTGDDWSRLGEKAERFAHFVGHRAYMKMEHGHCAALLVQPLPSGEKVYWCRLYQQRPQICRDLLRGSPECEGEREMKAARVAKGAKV